MGVKQWPVKKMKLEKLQPDPLNPREIETAGRDALSASMQRYGLAEIPVWNERTGQLVGGHQRVAELQRQGVAETPVVVVDLDEDEARELNITLNNKHVGGHFTDDVLELVKKIEKERPAVADALLMKNLVGEIDVDEGEPSLAPVDVQAPPSMAWALVGIPVTRYGEIAEIIEQLAGVASFCETTVNDGIKQTD